MSASSSIEWTDATVNFWWGCTKVGPGCDHCYAETLDHRYGGSHWGIGADRRKIKGAAALIHRLDNMRPRRRVFIQSMSDLFDLEVELDWFAAAWTHIEACTRLEIQIVTKRVSAVEKRLQAIAKPAWPQHAGLLITVCNQQEADRDIPRLLDVASRLDIPWIGISHEPALGPVDFTEWLQDGEPSFEQVNGPRGLHYIRHGVPRLDWIIMGGESGSGARPMHPNWVRSVRDQCATAGTAFFFKQWGGWTPIEEPPSEEAESLELDDRYQFSEDCHFVRVGKKHAGRLLDGIEHNAFPALQQREAA